MRDLLNHLPEHAAVRYVPFHPAHAMVMHLDDKHVRAVAKAGDIQMMLETQARLGNAITAYLHGRPVACFGAVDIWPGVAEMWLLIEERGRKFGKTLTRAAIVYRDYTVLSRNLHRVQLTVRSDDIRAVRWAQAIGFEQEGLMRRYGPDQADFYIFGRI